MWGINNLEYFLRRRQIEIHNITDTRLASSSSQPDPMEEPPSPRTNPAVNENDAPQTSQLADQATTNALPDRSATTATASNDTAPSSRPTSVPAWRLPTISGAAESDVTNHRRPSVQFVPQVTDNTAHSSSPTPAADRKASNAVSGRRLSSPPPPGQYTPGVGFDTFTNPHTSEFSLTLMRKHKDYHYTKRSRTFLCGTDTNEYSDTALEWLIDELVDDGDEVVCLRVVERDSKEAAKWAAGQGEKGYRAEADRFFDGIIEKNNEHKGISLILEFAVGKIFDTIQQMIRMYEPAILVVGTRGRSLTGYQGLLSSGSVSKYCLQYSPVPVIVVRPSSKRESKKRKRLQDPSRTGYRDILDKSEDAPRGLGSHLLDKKNRYSITGADLGPLGHLSGHSDPDEEARRVAEAIGYRGARSSIAAAGDSRASSTSRAAQRPESRDRVRSPSQERVLKSPVLGAADSPEASDDEEDDDSDEPKSPEVMRPEDEAALLAYERALKVRDEEAVEEEARQQREADRKSGRSASRGRAKDNGEGTGAAVLGLLGQLDRGIR